MKIDLLEVEDLATFRSEWIGTVWYYLITFKAKGKEMRATIHFDAEDLCEWSSEEEDYEPTDEDQDDYCSCLVDSLLCDLERCKTLAEVKEKANETIEHYNNGAWFTIDLN